MSKKEFEFSVQAELTYKIKANTEKQARKILVDKGGLDISYDDIHLEENDYKNAELIDTIDIK